MLDIIKYIYYVIILFFYEIKLNIEKIILFHHLIIILLFIHFFHCLNPNNYTKF
jgi:hypothetical protein